MEAKIDEAGILKERKKGGSENNLTKNDSPDFSYEIKKANSPKAVSPVVIKTEATNKLYRIEPMQSAKGQSKIQNNGQQKLSQEYLSEHRVEVKSVPNKFTKDGSYTEGEIVYKNKEKNTRQESEMIDVTSIEDDAHRAEWKFGNGRYTSKRSHSDSKGEGEREQDIFTKKYILENNYYRYDNSIGYPKESPEYLYYDKLRGNDIASTAPEYTKIYPAEHLKSQLVYLPTDGMREREAAYRQAYYEDMMQKGVHTQFKSAFSKPANIERETTGVKLLVPSIRYGYNHMPPYMPYYKHPSPREDEKDDVEKSESQTNLKRLPFGKKLKSDEDQREKHRELYEEYRPYGSGKYPSLDPSVVFQAEYPYLPYRGTLLSLDKIHPEAKFAYPCCIGVDKIPLRASNAERYIDVGKMSPYANSPAHAQFLSQTSKIDSDGKLLKNTQNKFYDHNGMNPSFKDFLDAERQSLAEHEKQTKTATVQVKNKTLQLWGQNKNETNSASHSKNGSKQAILQTVEGLPSTNESPPAKVESNGLTAVANQEDTLKTKTTQDKSDSNVKKIACSVCNKTFNRTSNLYTHMRTHSAHKPHACEFCGKRFHQKADLRIHRYIHTGEKPHKCTKCGRGFKQLTHLKYHMRTHSDVRMYKCPYCEKGFNQKSNLQAHIFGHTGQRPHKCDVCGKGFTLASTLNTHKRTHLPNKPFQCQFCERAFYQKNALKMHYVSTHPYSSGAV